MLLSIKLFLFFVSGWYTGKYFWMRNLAILYHELCLLIWNFLPAGICWQRNYSYWNIDSPWIPLLLSIASASWFSLSQKKFGGHRCMKGLRSGERRRVSIQVNIFGALFLLPNSYSQFLTEVWLLFIELRFSLQHIIEYHLAMDFQSSSPHHTVPFVLLLIIHFC